MKLGEPTPNLLQAIRTTYLSSLHLAKEDHLAIDFVLSVMASFHTGPLIDPPWSFLVGPPSSAKTEIVRGLAKIPYLQTLDLSTPKSWVSGYNEQTGTIDPETGKPGKDNKSFLHYAKGKVVLFPDFTACMTQNRSDGGEILGILRTVYDQDKFVKAFGTGLEEADVEVGLLACVTSQIDPFLLAGGANLGERFLKFRIERTQRPDQTGEREKSDKVYKTTRWKDGKSEKNDFREEIRPLVVKYLAPWNKRRLDIDSPVIPQEYRFPFFDACWLTSMGRSLPPGKTGFSEGEGTSRIQQQCQNLIWGRCALEGRSAWSEDDLKFIMRVLVDTMPNESMMVLSLFGRARDYTTVADVVSKSGLDATWVERILHQFAHTYILEAKVKKGWCLSDKGREGWETSGLVNYFPRRFRPDAYYGTKWTRPYKKRSSKKT